MALRVEKLRTKADRLRAEQAEPLRQMVLAYPGLPERAAGEIVATIDRNTAAENGWTFVMMSPADNAKVVDWLVANSARPLVAVRLWARCFDHLRRDTGEIMQTRDELAEAIKAPAEEVSRIMTELESFGAITKERIRVPGMKGPGMVRYRMNAWIATHIRDSAARDRAQAEAPQLRLVE